MHSYFISVAPNKKATSLITISWMFPSFNVWQRKHPLWLNGSIEMQIAVWLSKAVVHFLYVALCSSPIWVLTLSRIPYIFMAFPTLHLLDTNPWFIACQSQIKETYRTGINPYAVLFFTRPIWYNIGYFLTPCDGRYYNLSEAVVGILKLERR